MNNNKRAAARANTTMISAEWVKRAVVRLFLICGVGFVGACASASGPKFTPVAAQTDKAVIYIYRVGSIVGAANSWHLQANGKRVTKVTNGGYYVHYSRPGNVTFSAELQPGVGTLLLAPLLPVEELITVPAKAGEIYYVRFKIGPSMQLVNQFEGQSEIKSLNMFDPI